jgi:hypothetical protein
MVIGCVIDKIPFYNKLGSLQKTIGWLQSGAWFKVHGKIVFFVFSQPGQAGTNRNSVLK